MNKLLFALGFAASITSTAATSAATPATPAAPAAAAMPATPATHAKSETSVKPARYRTAGMPASARQYYAMTWGVDQLSAKLAESGQLVRFNYRVIDAVKAAPLNIRASSPKMIDEKAHVSLEVPTMEKIGPLRQSMAPENGKTYWMVFSNKGNYVKPGHRVSVLIGQFRVDGVVVQN